MLKLFIIYCIIGLVCCLLINLGIKRNANKVMTWKYIIFIMIVWPVCVLVALLSLINKQFAESVNNIADNFIDENYGLLDDDDES